MRAAGDMQGRWAFLFDIDGTLVEIAEAPDQVRVPQALSHCLAELAGRLGQAVAIVSGRRIAEIDRILSPFIFDAAGIHGAELRLNGQHRLIASLPTDRLARLVSELHLNFGKYGLVIEDKGVAAAVHWRGRPQLEGKVLEFIDEASGFLGREIRVQLGKAVAEIVPAASAKEIAMRCILDTTRYWDRTPIFFGDDLTDEGGFGLVNNRGGLSIRVGAGETSARYRFSTPRDLQRYVRELVNCEVLDPLKDLI
jgi:trehalose 6-phosphate phosphatase